MELWYLKILTLNSSEPFYIHGTEDYLKIAYNKYKDFLEKKFEDGDYLEIDGIRDEAPRQPCTLLIKMEDIRGIFISKL